MGRKKGSYTQRSLAIWDDCQREIEPFFGRITIRQLFYRMVSLGHYPSTEEKHYNNFVQLMIRLRLNGDIPLSAIVDNYRRLETFPAWDGPEDFIENVKPQYRTNWWLSQKGHVFIWLEKDALFDLVWDTAREFGVPVNVCRGYASLSNLNKVCKMVKDFQDKGGKHNHLYVGDHDPSGLDMEQALSKYEIAGVTIKTTRVAITYEQGKGYPPLPVKKNDKRAPRYIAQFGDQCWEVEAIPPKELVAMVRDAIVANCDLAKLKASKRANEKTRSRFVFQSSDDDDDENILREVP